MATMEAIQTTYLEAGLSFFDLNPVPATYEYIQAVGQLKSSGTSNATSIWFQLGDSGGLLSGSIYSDFQMAGLGGTIENVAPRTDQTSGLIYDAATGRGTQSDGESIGNFIINFFDYANANKNTSWSSTTGVQDSYIYGSTSGDRRTALTQGVVADASTVTRIIIASTGNCARGSYCTFYGIKSS